MFGASYGMLMHVSHIFKLVKTLKQAQSAFVTYCYEDHALDTKETPFSNHIFKLMLCPHISRSVKEIQLDI